MHIKYKELYDKRQKDKNKISGVKKYGLTYLANVLLINDIDEYIG